MAQLSRESYILENLKAVQLRISEACQASGRNASEVTLIAVTKNYPVSDVQILVDYGVSNFGENLSLIHI